MKVRFHEKYIYNYITLFPYCVIFPFLLLILKFFQMRNMIQFLLRLIQSHRPGYYLGELQKKDRDFQAMLTLKQTFVPVNLSCEPCLQNLPFK